MKISIYELLGLIKEGKAPKKIKIDGYILKLQENETYWKSKYIDKQGDSLFLDYHITLNDEVEIIEKEKDKLVKGVSHTYEDSLGKINYVNEDIYIKLVKVLNKMYELEGGKND